jgi:hypothetical protein
MRSHIYQAVSFYTKRRDLPVNSGFDIDILGNAYHFHKKDANIMPYSKAHQTHQTPAQEEAAENEDVKKLLNVVEKSLERIAKITSLPLQEVMHIMEEVDVALLKEATQEAIKEIADSTDLNRAHIVAIFKEDRTATIDNIVHRLREESHIHRARW